MTRDLQQDSLELIQDLNARSAHAVGDPEIESRISAYEMAHRLQSSAPELMDLNSESAGNAWTCMDAIRSNLLLPVPVWLLAGWSSGGFGLSTSITKAGTHIAMSLETIAGTARPRIKGLRR